MLRRLSAGALRSFTVVGAAALAASGGCGGGSKSNEGAAPQTCADVCAAKKASCDAGCKGDARCARSCAEVSQNCQKVCAAHEKPR